MNSLRKPEFLLSLTSFVGIVGLSIYLYRQTLANKKNLENIHENITQISKKVGDHSLYGNQITQIAQLTQKVSMDHNKTRKTLANIQDAQDELRELVDAIISTLENNGTEIVMSKKVTFAKSKAKPPQKQVQRNTVKQTRRQLEEEQEQDDDGDTINDDETEEDIETDVDSAIRVVRNSRR